MSALARLQRAHMTVTAHAGRGHARPLARLVEVQSPSTRNRIRFAGGNVLPVPGPPGYRYCYDPVQAPARAAAGSLGRECCARSPHGTRPARERVGGAMTTGVGSGHDLSKCLRGIGDSPALLVRPKWPPSLGPFIPSSAAAARGAL